MAVITAAIKSFWYPASIPIPAGSHSEKDEL